MRTWIALLRGINVGGKNLLPMKQLVAIFACCFANSHSGITTKFTGHAAQRLNDKKAYSKEKTLNSPKTSVRRCNAL